jgi:glycosyltransferase involved in cell wall biosynthesis
VNGARFAPKWFGVNPEKGSSYDSDDMHKVIRSMLTDPAMMESMIHAGLERATQFRRETAALQFLAIFNDMKTGKG